MKRKEQRMLFLGALVACFAAAAVLVLVALEDTVTFFDTRRVGPVTHSSYEGLSVKRWGGMLYSMVMSPPAERIGIWSCRVGTCWHRSRLRARTQLLSGRLPAVSPVRPSIPLAPSPSERFSIGKSEKFSVGIDTARRVDASTASLRIQREVRPIQPPPLRVHASEKLAHEAQSGLKRRAHALQTHHLVESTKRDQNVWSGHG